VSDSPSAARLKRHQISDHRIPIVPAGPLVNRPDARGRWIHGRQRTHV